MPSSLLNKNVILLFSDYATLKQYVPSILNNVNIAIDKMYNNWYIYNNSNWVLFRENVPISVIPAPTDLPWPKRYIPYQSTGIASQSYTQPQIGNISLAVNANTSTRWNMSNCIYSYEVFANTSSYWAMDNVIPTVSVSMSLN